MELWDILDEKGNKTGRTMVRGDRIKRGDYHLVVHIWAKNEKGEYLIQKRAKTVFSMPGKWSSTSGSVVAGEDSLTTAVREAKEELGIDAPPERFRFVRRLMRRQDFADVSLLTQPVDVSALVLQKQEVEAVKWASRREITEMVQSGEFPNYGREYFDLLFSV